MRPGSSEVVITALASLLDVPKYSHHIASVPMKVAPSASSTPASQCSCSDITAPVATSVSPSATITNSWQRSARCPPSMVHSLVSERPIPGKAKPNIGEKYSQAMATSQSAMRIVCASTSPPAIQNAAEMLSQPSMRR